MRAAILILVVTLFGVRDAAAEKVKTNQSTKVYSRPGEQAKVLLKLKSGQNMTVLAKEGRWLKVRVQGRTGYVPRTKVDLPDDDELVRNTRRRAFVDGRGTKRGFGGETGPDDRVGADATGDGQDDSGDKGDKGDSDDDSDKPAKASKAKKPSKDDDEDDDKPTKASKTSKAKKPSKDDDEDDDKSAKSSKSKKAKGGDKSDDEDDDEDTVVVDDAKTGEPDESDARPTAHVSEKTKILNDPSNDSEESFVAKPDTVLYPAETKGKWTRVENDDGDTGWILSDSLDVDDGGGDSGGSHARTMDAHARLGVMFLSQSMKGTGGMAAAAGAFNPDNYTVGSSAIAVALGGELLYPWKKKYVVGGEATLDYAKTLLGGIHIPQTTNTTSADTPVAVAVFNLRGMIGYDLKKKSGMTLFGRLGYRYQAFMVDGYDNIKQNPAMLPQETIAAPTLGGAIAIPKLTDKVGLTVTLDFILAGSSVSQTAGYQDGTSPSAKAAFLGGVIRYKWKPDMDFQGTYNLDYMSVNFGKPSADPMLNQRGHTATDVSRTDMNHIVTFGIIKGF